MKVKTELHKVYILYFSCWPNEDDNIVLEKLNRRIEHATGLKAATNKNYSEPYMVMVEMLLQNESIYKEVSNITVWKLWYWRALLDPSGLPFSRSIPLVRSEKQG